MPKPIIYPNFSKGLVNEDSRAKLGESYTQKCSELENFWIATDDTLRRRPPLVQTDTPLAELNNIVDYQVSEGKLYVLTNVTPNQIPNLPEALRRVLGIEIFLGPRDLTKLYTSVEGRLEAETEVQLDSGVADASLRAYVQMIHVFDAETKEALSDEGYIIASAQHDLRIEQQGRTISITAHRARTAGSLPSEYPIQDVKEPAVAMIFKGTDSEAELLGSGHTVSFKRFEQALPSTITTAVEDVRTEFSPILEDSPRGQTEFLTSDPNDILNPLDDLDVHPLGGVTFLFAGLLYRLEDNLLRCENGPSLFPDMNTLTTKNLRTLVEDNRLETDISLPIKVLYVPATQTPEATEATKYTQAELRDALGRNIVAGIGDRGFTQPVGIEHLLSSDEMVGFEYTAFQQLFPVLQPLLKNIKQVVGYYQNPATGATSMYPDIKTLAPDSDINAAGEYFPLYRNEQGENRAAISMSSVPRLNFSGQAFKTIAAGTTEFQNGSGIAAGGVGITVALYKNINITRDTTTGALDIGNTATQIPTGVLYFYIDYSAQATLDYFNKSDVISGFSSSGDKYHSAIMRKATATKVKPTVTFEQILASSISTVAPDGTGVKNLYSDTELKPNTERHLVFPFGPVFTQIEKFATPCYYISETPASGAAVHTWALGNTLTSEVDGSNLPFNINQTMLRYLVYPTTYKTNTGRLHILQGRAAIADGNQVHFSEVGELANYSNPLARFWDSFVTASRSYNVLQASGVEGVVGSAPTDPETRVFKDSTGRAATVEAILGDSPNRTFIGTRNSIHRVLPSSFLGSETGLSIDKISDYGVTSNFVSDSTYTVAAIDNKVLVLRYYEEASGYTVDVINEETQLQDIDTVVSLVGKHRLVLLHKQNTNVIYTMAVGSDRRFKGFSRLVFADNIFKIKAITPDTVGCLIAGGAYAELDFRADKDTVYEDNVAGRRNTFESRLATLPIVIVNEKINSPQMVTSPNSMTIACSGFIDFTASIIDDDNNDVSSKHIRLPDAENIDETRQFHGLFTQRDLTTTNSTSPRIRISKQDKKYMSIGSLIIMVD